MSLPDTLEFIDISNFKAGDSLTIRTLNSKYTIKIISINNGTYPEIEISGGKYAESKTKCFYQGSTDAAARNINKNIITVGQSMQFLLTDQSYLRTSRVSSISRM